MTTARSNPENNNGVEEKDFEVRWNGPDDRDDPRNLPTWRKWLRLMIVSQGAFSVTFASSVYTSISAKLMEDFHCSREVATLGLSLFVLGFAFGPLLLGPLSEFYGRRPIYLVSLMAILIWLIPCAVAKNIQTMLVGRFLTGFSGSAFLSVSGGTITDLFNRDQLQLPMSIYAGTVFLGPTFGPVVSGFIGEFANWRWVFYIQLIWTGIILVLVVFFVPETFAMVLLRNKARRLRKSTGEEQWYAPIEKQDRTVHGAILHSCSRPFQMLFLDPMCLHLCLYSAILLGILYLFFSAFFIVFENNHGFNLWQSGLTFIGTGCGMPLAMLSDGLWRKNYLRLVRNAKARIAAEGGENATSDDGAEPEFRLPPALFGSILIPISLFWFAWTIYPSIHWIVPIIASVFFGAGFFLTFTAIFTFLGHSYGTYAASALAANTFTRCCFAAAFPLFCDQMYDNLGYQWATTLLAFLTLAMAPFLFLFYTHGAKIREKSRFAN